MNQFPQKFLTNPSELRLYLCKISTVITETLIVLKPCRLKPDHNTITAEGQSLRIKRFAK